MPTVTVSLVKVQDDLEAAFGRAMELAGLGDVVLPGDRVLLKPNEHGGDRGYTSPLVLRAAARGAFGRGAGEVWIGDGPNWGIMDATEYFRHTGLQAACDETGARALNFHAGEFTVFRPESPDLPETLGFSRYLEEADVVLNVPVMKTHLNTLVTLGMKNLKGCLRPVDKKTFHEIELNAALAEVNRLLRPRIAGTILDATVAMEGMGPAVGTPVEMGLLLASEDVVAVDAVACDLMGIDPREVRLLRYGAERGVGETDLARIAVVGESPADHRRRFELPYEALARSFPGLQVRSEGACSGCAMNLFRAMEIAQGAGQAITCRTVVIGPSFATEGQTLLVGRCTKEGWTDRPHVPGCPPRVEAIRQELTGIGTREDVPRS
jgi:uncharacterized protein (DUF362 family)